MRTLEIGYEIDLYQDGNTFQKDELFTIREPFGGRYKAGNKEWQKYYVSDQNGANTGYLVFSANDEIKMGDCFSMRTTQTEKTTTGDWPFFRWTLARLVSRKEALKVRCCQYNACTLRACIDSDFCLDHQTSALAPNSAEWYLRLDRPCILRCGRFAIEGSSFCQACYDSTAATASKADHLANVSETANKESTMNGTVYTGHVVRTKVIAAGEGVTTGVQSSEVVFTTTKPIVAPNPDAARAVILALAIVASAKEEQPIDPTDPRTTVEVKLVTAS